MVGTARIPLKARLISMGAAAALATGLVIVPSISAGAAPPSWQRVSQAAIPSHTVTVCLSGDTVAHTVHITVTWSGARTSGIDVRAVGGTDANARWSDHYVQSWRSRDVGTESFDRPAPYLGVNGMDLTWTVEQRSGSDGTWGFTERWTPGSPPVCGSSPLYAPRWGR